jgi:N-acylglucosamine-6-phosphate 2-epimerase
VATAKAGVEALAAMRGGLVVSAQAPPGSPLRDPIHMAAMARAAAAGGACGVRADGARDIAAIRAAIDLPLIGLRKRASPDTPVVITPSLEDAREAAAAGADMIAVDATQRPRAGGGGPGELIAQLRREVGLPVLADVDCYAAGLAAVEAGAAAVATTLSGYVPGPPPDEPDLALVERLAAALPCPVLAEGRYAAAADVRRAFHAGAHAVVIGTAITDPVALTRRFAAAAPRAKGQRAPS